ncbi:pleckstrin homology domain-containing family O member 1-A [Cynoglossus semilaevis]|uniref:pleckstrin homology domain-containing family O member 1-A n=1 Tax=Cynoglossus semilaevis TaxID=244447 RepID=UPI000D62787E|nr:pleckstrin homology domain-containing family O member 1-A [Cynoglossus semilaevis]
MKRSRARGVQDQGHQGIQQPEKSGWIRKFCGRGIFRELWRNRFVVLRGTHLFISDREVKDERKAQEVLDLADYERSEELRKAKSRSKKNHSRFTLLRSRRPGSNVPNLVFLAFSPEEKESWVNAINVAIVKAKNRRVLDEVTIEEGGALAHPTRDRAKVPRGRRLPTRGHLLSVASTSSRGMLTLDLVAEEDSCSLDDDADSSFQVDRCDGHQDVGGRRRADTDASKLRTTPKESKVKTGSLPRGSGWYCSKSSQLDVCRAQKNQQVQVLQAQCQTPQPGKRFSVVQGRSRCASMDEVLSSRPAMVRPDLRRRRPTEDESVGGACEQPVAQPVGQLQSLIAQRMQRAQEMLEEMRLQELQKSGAQRHRGGGALIRFCQGVQDQGHQGIQQPEKSGWIRKFCGRGIFRELWRNRFVVLRGTHLFISDREVKDERKAQEVLDLADYERSEELRKAKSRSKKNHSRFTLLRSRRPGSNVPNLVFLAFSPEEKESWVNAINVAIVKAKNRRVLDEVTIEEGGALAHPTRDRAKVPRGRRLPTRGHLLSVASTSSRGMLTLDLVAEEDSCSLDDDADSSFQVDRCDGHQDDVGGRRRADTDASKLRTTPKESKVKTGSLPRGSGWYCSKSSQLDVCRAQKNQQVQVLQAQCRTPQPGKRFSVVQGRSRCASMDEVLSSRPAMVRPDLRRRRPTEDESVGGACEQPVAQPVGQLQSLIAQRMQRAQEMLEEMRLQELQKSGAQRHRGGSSSHLKNLDSPRLHHLRGCDSPNGRSPGSRSRSSDSPRLRPKESPRLRGRESPRTKAKKNRCKRGDSPRSRRPQSPVAKANASPHDSPPSKMSDASVASNDHGLLAEKSPQSSVSIGEGVSSQVHSADSRQLHVNGDDNCSHVTGSQGSPRHIQDAVTLCPSQEKNVDSPLEDDPPTLVSLEEAARRRAEAERLLEEAVSSWKEAQEVLQEVRELQSQTLRRQRRRTYEKMTSPSTTPATEEEDTPSPVTSPENDGDEAP